MVTNPIYQRTIHITWTFETIKMRTHIIIYNVIIGLGIH